MKRLTTYDHQPPPEMKSVTKYQPTTAEMRPMNGNRQIQRKARAAMRTRKVSERRASDHPWKWPREPGDSQPNQCQAVATKKPQASTATKAKMPAASHLSATRSAPATNNSTTRISSAQAVWAPPPRYWTKR